jgi:methylenetetrahydrofolate reductase (NADPH)
MLFDADSYERFLEDTAKAGCAIPVLPGTRLLKSKSQAQKMSQRFEIPIPAWYIDMLPETDAEATPGRTLEAFFSLNEKLKSRGAPGMHIFVLSDTELASQALSTLAAAPSESTLNV